MSANKHTNKLKLQNYAYEISDAGNFDHKNLTSNVYFQNFKYNSTDHTYSPADGHGNYPFIEAMDLDWRPYKVNGTPITTTYDVVQAIENAATETQLSLEGEANTNKSRAVTGARVNGNKIYLSYTEFPSYIYLGNTYVAKADLVAQSYVSKSDLTSQAYVKKSDLVGQSYVTKSDLSAQSYVTKSDLSAQSYAGYSYVYGAYTYLLDVITENELIVSTAITDIDDRLNNLDLVYVSKSDLSAQGYLQSVPANYITNTHLDTAAYVKKSELSAQSYVTQTTLTAQGYLKSHADHSISPSGSAGSNVTSGTINVITGLAGGTAGHGDLPLSYKYQQITIPDTSSFISSETNISLGSATGGAGKAITALSVSGTNNHTITATYGSFLTSETNLSMGSGTGGAGKAITQLTVSGHQITASYGSFITSETNISLGSATGGAGKAITSLSVSGTNNHTITATYGSFLTSETNLSMGSGTGGAGKAITQLTVSGHQITASYGSFLTSETNLSLGSATGGAGKAITSLAVSGTNNHTLTATYTTFPTYTYLANNYATIDDIEIGFSVDDDDNGGLFVQVASSTIDTDFNIPMMSPTGYGVAKSYYGMLSSNVNVQTQGSTADRWYGVQANKDGKLVVNVPWSGTTTLSGTNTNKATAITGANISGSTLSFSYTTFPSYEYLNNTYVSYEMYNTLYLYGGSNNNGYFIGIDDEGDNLAVEVHIPPMTDSAYGVAKSYYGKLSSNVNVQTQGSTADRWYGVQPTKDGKLVVNVPWSGTGTIPIMSMNNIGGGMAESFSKQNCPYTLGSLPGTGTLYPVVVLSNDGQLYSYAPGGGGGSGTDPNAVHYQSNGSGVSGMGPVHNIQVVTTPGTDTNTLYIVV